MKSFDKLVSFVSVHKDPRRTSSFVNLKHIGHLSFDIRALVKILWPTLEVKYLYFLSFFFQCEFVILCLALELSNIYIENQKEKAFIQRSEVLGFMS